MSEHKGIFISFEGIDGCGKSTQVRLLAAALEERGHECLFLREPGGTELGEGIRDLLLREFSSQTDPRSELLLFLAARSQIVSECILPALARGEIVICDRFYDSTMAYQGYGRGLPLDYLRDLNSFACRGLKPDMTILLEASEELCAERLAGRKEEQNRFDLEAQKFRERVRQGFQSLAEAEPARFSIFSTAGKRELTAQTVLQAVLDKFDL
ncbi:MAG: dTMP kinase [Eubacteriales bacterium]|nr:dTMP kinase [Eubacteriales bacterium]